MWGLFPHSHLRGKCWNYVLELPGGVTKPVLSVPKYDFNWQTYYLFREPWRFRKAPGSFRSLGTTTRRPTARNLIRQ